VKLILLGVQRPSGQINCYAEGFAGPGIYTDGAPGSPVIALRTIIQNKRLRTSAHKIRLLFVDRDRRCTTLLADQLGNAASPVSLDDLPQHGITVDVRTGPCVPTLENLGRATK
jgi:three-Cys-motif partner protein